MPRRHKKPKSKYKEKPEPSPDGNLYLWKKVLVLGKGVIREMYERTWCLAGDRPLGEYGEPVSIAELVQWQRDKIMQRRAERVEAIAWDLIVNGRTTTTK